MTVKRLIQIGGLVVWASIPPSLTMAETWCIRDDGSVTSGVCAFSSAQDCVRAAMAGPGGICAHENAKATKAIEPSVKHPAAPSPKQADR